MNQTNDSSKRDIRSFVIRSGRMTEAQRAAYHEHQKKWGLSVGEQTLSSPEVFNNDNPITLEIGFGMGDSLAQMAIENPLMNFVGIEVHRAGVGRLLRLIEENGIDNLRLYCDDAKKVLDQDAPNNSLDRINLFFPDPWHKTKHHKRRLVQATFLDMIANKLTERGLFHVATDWQPYAKHVVETIDAHPHFSYYNGSTPYVAAKDFGRPETKFERRGVKLGHGVWDMAFRVNQ